MATAQDCLKRLQKLDDALTDEYMDANADRRAVIDLCREAIAATINEIIRQDLHSRNDDIGRLTNSLNNATAILKNLKTTVQTATKLLGSAATVVNTARAVLAII